MYGIKTRKKFLLLFLTVNLFFLFLPVTSLYAEYPQIKICSARDVLYSQLQIEISRYYKATGRGKNDQIPNLKIFQVSTVDFESIFSFSAKVNIPYETIASLNRLGTASDFTPGSFLLVSNLPGIFIPKTPGNDLEEIMRSCRSDSQPPPQPVTVYLKGKRTEFLFYPGEHFHPEERAFFLRFLFRLPVQKRVQTSAFGYRPDPFTGHQSFHGGVDLAAPIGSPVFASADGTVTFCGFSDILGNYIIISHPSGYETLYGHLKEFLVKPGMSVDAGKIIGKVGLTGKTTGPHLHFEIRKKGKRENPDSLLRH